MTTPRKEEMHSTTISGEGAAIHVERVGLSPEMKRALTTTADAIEGGAMTTDPRPFVPEVFGFVSLPDGSHSHISRWRFIHKRPDHEPYYWYIERYMGPELGEWMQVYGDQGERYYGRWPDSHDFAVALFRHLGLLIEGVK